MEHRTNDWIQSRFNFLVGAQEPLATVKRWKLAWFRHITCHDDLSKTTLQGTLDDGLQSQQMTRIRLVLMLYFFMVAHKAACQTLSKAFSLC